MKQYGRYFSCFFILVLSSVFLGSCVTVIDATTDKPLEIDPGKRSFGEYIDDQKLETVVEVNIRKADPGLDKAHVNVHSYNAVVLLTGEVPNVELRELAGDIARKVSKVRQVYNELTIGPRTTFLSRANDNWIQSRIKGKLMINGDIDSSRVKIVSEDNVVYLMGRVTRPQAEKITDVVRKTRGVKKVVRAIEYLEPPAS